MFALVQMKLSKKMMRNLNKGKVMRKDQNKSIDRYSANERTNHWIVAMSFIMVTISGLSLFHPVLFWMSSLFGGGVWVRILHPFFGLVMVVAFYFFVIPLWKDNQIKSHDIEWIKHIKDVFLKKEDNLPQVDKYNAGQKLLYYFLICCMGILFFSGIIIWRSYFSMYFSIPMIRKAVLAHSVFALMLICAIIVHIYAAIWVKGSITAMIRGKVTKIWALKHHSIWFHKINHQSKSDKK